MKIELFEKQKTYEYITICERCGKLNIVSTLKPKYYFKHGITTKCPHCREITHQQIIGRVKKQYKRWNSLKIKYFKNANKTIDKVMNHILSKTHHYIQFAHGKLENHRK